MKKLQDYTMQDWLRSLGDMIAAELRYTLMVICGLALILAWGLLVPFAGERLAQQRTEAEQNETAAAPDPIEEQPVIRDYRASSDDGWSETALEAAQDID